jgi:NAD(P)-dependent dehydrogenase (short-subunit alcohol dehydrogenase family)
MAERLAGKVAVITGAGNGIGRATALRFAEEGAAVIAADLQESAAAETAAQVEAAGGRAAAIAVDVASRVDTDAMAALALERFGGLHVVVTAAGISHAEYNSGDTDADIKWAMSRMEYMEAPARGFAELERDAWEKVLDVNLTGTLLSLQSCVAAMLEAQTMAGSSLITIASIAAKHPDAGPLPYTVSKAGVWMLTKKLARDLAPAGIRVNSIGPGYIQTNMTAVVNLMPEERQEQLLASIPLGHRGEPIDIANAALFLASDEARYFTGEILHPDGGFYTE